MLNHKVAETRRKKHEKELERRMKNPLTYPTKGETLADQNRLVPKDTTLAKLGILGQKRYMGNIELENMIMDNKSKYGLLVNSKHVACENPSLLREAMRPSLIT